MSFQTNISMASCTAEEKMESKGCDTPGLGSSLNGEKFDGLGSRTNHFTVEGKTTLINGKDVKPLEWTAKDSVVQAATILLIPLLLPIMGPLAVVVASHINVSRYSDKMEKIEESKKLDFFNEDVRDQFSNAMTDIYQSNLVEMDNKATELTSLYGTEWRIEDLKESVDSINSTYYTAGEFQEMYDKAYGEIGDLQANPEIGKIAELENKIADPSLSDEQKSEFKAELDSLIERAETLSADYQQLKDDIPIMKLACEEVKDASTQNGVPSLEVLHIFNEHSTDRDGFKDIQGAENYMSFLSDTYAQNGFAESNISNIFSDTETTFNVANMDVAESYINLMEIMPTDCNPREVFSGAMIHAASDAQSGLEKVNLNDNVNLGEMVSDFNQRFADGEEKMTSMINKIDNQTIKNHAKETKNDNNDNHSDQAFQQREIAEEQLRQQTESMNHA